jgi:hypothetical protein
MLVAKGHEVAVIWFAEMFHADGLPYRPEEVDFISSITGYPKAAASGAGSEAP